MKQKILNLGCGSNYLPGAVNVDHPGMKGKVKADVWFDLEQCNSHLFDLSYKITAHQDGFNDIDGMVNAEYRSEDICANHFDKVILRHVFEHVRNVIPMMEEIYRLLKPGGTVEITCPYWTSIWAWGDIGHVRAVNEMTFIWFSKEHYEENRKKNTTCSYYEPDCDFEIKDIKLSPTAAWKDVTEPKVRIGMLQYLNVIEEIKVVLEAIK